MNLFLIKKIRIFLIIHPVPLVPTVSDACGDHANVQQMLDE